MKNKILNNFGLKISALVLAFIVWLAVVNINDPVITRTIMGVPVTLTNTAYVETLGLSCRMESGSSTVNVSMTGHRSVVEPLTKDQIRAVADLTQIVSMDADPIMVPVQVQTSTASLESISVTPGNIAVTLEEMQSADFMITPTAGDSKPYNTTYQVGTMTATPESVTITGPASLISIIDRVTAPVDVSTMTSDTNVEASLQIYDKNGQLFNDTQMGSLRFSAAQGSIAVHVDIWRIMSDIALRGRTSGTPASGYKVGDITVTPSVITIAGTEEALQAIEESGSMIALPPELIDVAGASEDIETRIDLTQILPAGTKLADNAAGTALVSVEILALDTRTFEIPTNTIKQLNLTEGLGVVFQRDKIKVRLQGSGEAFNALKVDDITASIDFSGMKAQSQIELPVMIDTGGVDAQVAEVTAVLDIAAIETSQEEEAESGD